MQATPAHNERVVVAEFMPANGTFRIVFLGARDTRLVVLKRHPLSLLWEVAQEIKFRTPSTTQSLAGGMMSTSTAMFHFVEEPEAGTVKIGASR